MLSITYVSSAAVPFAKDDLQKLLTGCRKNNTAIGVTGMLLFRGGNFMQVLEGEESTVSALYQKISRDPRHSGALILLKEQTEQRAFGDWSMAFRDLSDPDVLALPGFSVFLNVDDDRDFFRDPNRAQRLLSFFKQSTR
jgi:hypothetical protein